MIMMKVSAPKWPLLISLMAFCFALSSANLAPSDQQETKFRANVSDDMHLISKSLEDLLAELSVIKQEANGRLSLVKNRASTSDQERIRQTKVSRFVLKRVAELESESLLMREELSKIFALQKASADKKQTVGSTVIANSPLAEPKQEDHDFDEQPTTTQKSNSNEGMPATTTTTTTAPNDDEAAKLGFDMEALKKLGDELESELEARQRQNPESLRGVHEQVIKLVDNMVQNYLGNVRRTVQRITNLIDNRRAGTESKPRSTSSLESPASSFDDQSVDESGKLRQSILSQVSMVSKQMHDFQIQWARVVGKQQSPLIDRIPFRGVELWRDFWDTVRKQVRRINVEFRQLAQDMSRMVTGRIPDSRGPRPTDSSLLYYSSNDGSEHLSKRFQEFYDRMSISLSEEQEKLDSLSKNAQNPLIRNEQNVNLIDDQDDQVTKDELTRNVALRQQIQQEISVFGSIFDIMRAFIQRLRESATNAVRDVIQPSASNNNNNDPVTPGPSIKPQVDNLLGETINSQRNINSQSKPVLLPNSRPSLSQQG